jgi:RIO-like serine/threonine protein kinase
VHVLHRDFSPGNIIIDEASVGWLIDWDLSRLLSGNEIPRRASRTVCSLPTPQVSVLIDVDL